MPCDCTTPQTAAPVSPTLPTLDTECMACPGSVPCIEPPQMVAGSVAVCPDENALRSTSSCGYTLPNGYTDAVSDHNSDGITILGRIGQKLAKFTGSGFLRIIDGKARVVSSIPMKATTLWHEWWKPTGLNQRPILGVPYPYPHQVISDSEGNFHLVKGHSEDDSVSVWNATAEQWEVRPCSEFPLLAKGRLPRVEALELTGFAAIPVNGTKEDVRALSGLSGSGILIASEADTVASECDSEGCTPLPAKVTVARFLANPTVASTLKWNSVDGVHWDAD